MGRDINAVMDRSLSAREASVIFSVVYRTAERT
jgi:hypothetical protein